MFKSPSVLPSFQQLRIISTSLNSLFLSLLPNSLPSFFNNHSSTPIMKFSLIFPAFSSSLSLPKQPTQSPPNISFKFISHIISSSSFSLVPFPTTPPCSSNNNKLPNSFTIDTLIFSKKTSRSFGFSMEIISSKMKRCHCEWTLLDCFFKCSILTHVSIGICEREFC